MSEPKTSFNQQRFSVVLEDGERIFVVVPLYPQFHYGDVMRVSGKVTKRMLTNEKAYLAMYFPKIEADQKEQNFALAITSSIRQKVTLLFQKTLPPVASSLLLGITFGIKEQMPKDFFDKLQATGVLHVVVASGMNVTMLGGVVSSFFALFLHRQLALLFTLGAICFYALLAGFEPSILRASIMGILVFAAQIIGRQYMASYSLFLAAAVMLLVDLRLLFDIGFQLSFLATLGLIYIRPLFGRRGVFSEDIATTISAQAATLPILLANFGTYSILSVLVNGLVLWTVPILMIIGGIGAVVGLVFEWLGQAVLYLSIPILMYFTEAVELFSKKGGMLVIDTFPGAWIVSYYCLLLAMVFYAQKSRSH